MFTEKEDNVLNNIKNVFDFLDISLSNCTNDYIYLRCEPLIDKPAYKYVINIKEMYKYILNGVISIRIPSFTFTLCEDIDNLSFYFIFKISRYRINESLFSDDYG